MRAAGAADFLRGVFAAALAAADPRRCLPGRLPAPPASGIGRTVVVGAGKAAAAMAQAVEREWPGELAGFVVVPYGYALPCRRIDVVEAAHPVPDAAGMAAAARALAGVAGLGEDDLLLALISGGGSSLLALPAPGVSLAQKQAVTRQLLKSGANIHDINTVRKRLSAIKGGRLAVAAWPAAVETLVVSDVPGDDPADVASGPTVADRSSDAEARAVLARYGVDAPALDSPPAADDPRFARCRARIVASGMTALEAAAAEAERRGVTPIILGDRIEGESREVAKAIAAQALLCAAEADPARPCVLLSGGETTVTVKGRGRGGRNTEFLLALAIALRGAPGIHAIACDSDGIDGSADNAGGMIGPATLARAAAAGLDAAGHLADNDAYGFFAGLGDLVVTGPTFTNVNDFRAILIDGRS